MLLVAHKATKLVEVRKILNYVIFVASANVRF